MVYKLLKDVEQLLSGKESISADELKILNCVRKVLPTLRNTDDSELLRKNEVIIRICPATNHPVLACYEGDNMCSCLHNETVKEDAVDIKQWLASSGEICTGNQRLLEAVTDIAYNAGAESLCEGCDSRMVVDKIIEWAHEFEQKNTSNDWRDDDYITAIDGFYNEKVTEFKQENLRS